MSCFGLLILKCFPTFNHHFLLASFKSKNKIKCTILSAVILEVKAAFAQDLDKDLSTTSEGEYSEQPTDNNLIIFQHQNS